MPHPTHLGSLHHSRPRGGNLIEHNLELLQHDALCPLFFRSSATAAASGHYRCIVRSFGLRLTFHGSGLREMERTPLRCDRHRDAQLPRGLLFVFAFNRQEHRTTNHPARGRERSGAPYINYRECNQMGKYWKFLNFLTTGRTDTANPRVAVKNTTGDDV